MATYSSDFRWYENPEWVQEAAKGEHGYEAFKDVMGMGRPSLLDPSQLTLGADAVDQRLKGINQTSAWGKMLLDKQALEEKQAMDNTASQADGLAAQARTQLAMRGGLGTGARTSLAREALRAGLMGKQNVAQQGAINRLGIQQQDYQNQMGQASVWAQMLAKDNQAKNDLLTKNKEFEMNEFGATKSGYLDMIK